MDPQEHDIESYLDFANGKGMEITYVIETHIQADHVSGGLGLSNATGAQYCLHGSADVDFEFVHLRDGQELDLGNVSINILHTPGHRPESICLVVTDKTRGPEPWFVLTGDTLFVGAVGRPDLPGNINESAVQLYDSLKQKLLVLPDTLEIYPSHFSGSVCGAGMSGKPMSTLAFEKRWNPILNLDRAAFVERITSGIPAKPPQMESTLRKNQGRL